MPVISYFPLKQLFCSTCLLTKEKRNHQDFFPILHYEESPEKSQYDMSTSFLYKSPPPSPPPPPFCLTSHFLVKSFRHPNLHQFWKSRTPILLLMKWGGLNHGMMFFSFEKVLNDQIYSSLDAHHLIKKSTPSKISILPPLGGIFSPHLAFRKP